MATLSVPCILDDDEWDPSMVKLNDDDRVPNWDEDAFRSSISVIPKGQFSSSANPAASRRRLRRPPSSASTSPQPSPKPARKDNGKGPFTRTTHKKADKSLGRSALLCVSRLCWSREGSVR